MAQTENNKPQPIKTRQIAIRLTAEQDLMLKQHCVKNGVNTQQAVLQALQGLIAGFPQP